MELQCVSVRLVEGAPGSDLQEHATPLGDVVPGVTLSIGPASVSMHGGDDGFDWALINSSDRPLAVWSVGVVARVIGASDPLRMFRHGYQSWSASRTATLGADVDPSRHADFPFVQGVYHADGRQTRADELRSEWCTALAAHPATNGHRSGCELVLGFDAGSQHDGTFRLRRGADDHPELVIEAHLGGAVLAPGEERRLHGVSWTAGGRGTASERLAAWAGAAGQAGHARVDAPFQVGWCSWYHFFDKVTEDDLRRNLAVASDWPFDVFQLDDGYQAAIGDWRVTNDKFPSTLDTLAADITTAGMRPGLWLAPFLAAPDSEIARLHPEWLARVATLGQSGKAEPLRSWWNPAWGGGEEGFMYSLDTTHPDVIEHLERVASDIVEAGFTYLKLDFTFAPGVEGQWHDASRTPAQRVRAGFEAIRRGAGESTFLLGCGVPLANVVGVVDANRIGPDVAPLWALDPADEIVPGYLDVQPATRSAMAATFARSFMHRQLWLNDPDCLMLRSSETTLDPDAVKTWEHCVGLSGGMVLVSDDLALLNRDSRIQLEEVVALGRSSDAAAHRGRPPRCPDLLDHGIPDTLVAEIGDLHVDSEAATSTFTRR
jgi:alpha-galactosidase